MRPHPIPTIMCAAALAVLGLGCDSMAPRQSTHQVVASGQWGWVHGKEAKVMAVIQAQADAFAAGINAEAERRGETARLHLSVVGMHTNLDCTKALLLLRSNGAEAVTSEVVLVMDEFQRWYANDPATSVAYQASGPSRTGAILVFRVLPSDLR